MGPPPPPALDQKLYKNGGLILDPLLDIFWGPLGAKNSSKRLPRGVSRGLRRETPKQARFWIPPERAQVSSRLGESTVFHVFHGSFLDPVLNSCWFVLEVIWNQMLPKRPLRAHLVFGSRFYLETASKRGGLFDNKNVFLNSGTFPEPVCCWNAPGPRF